MRAAVFRAVDQPLQIENVAEPEPGPSDLVLRVRSCGICGSDLHVAATPAALPAGSLLGHEFVGEVAAVGPEAEGGFEIGERVTSLPAIGCGRCVACLSGEIMRCEALRSIGLGDVPGAYAEFVRVGSRETLRLPDAVDDRLGALVEPLSVGLHAVRDSGLRAGQSALVLGGGPIGLAVVLWARFFGARSVVVSEPASARRERAAAIGASATIDPGSEDVAAAFADVAGGPPELIFECVGAPGMLPQCITLAPSRGRIVSIGVCMEPETFVPVLALLKELRLWFALGYNRSDFELTIEMLESGRIAAEQLVTDVVDLDGLPAAFEALKKPSTQCKVIVVP